MRIRSRAPKHFLFFLAASLLVVFAFLVRERRAHFGLPYVYYWDEPQLASAALQMLKSGDLNPHMYDYGSLLVYIYYLVDIPHFLFLMTQPENSNSYINYMSDIATGANTGWYWSISHPSFYFVDRFVNVLFGTGTVILTYFLANRVLMSRWLGLAAASFMAVLGIHIQYSALITPDVPAAFFVTGVVLFSLVFLEGGKLAPLVAALVFCGLGAATKYNSGLSVITPASAILLRYALYPRESFDRRWLVLLVAIPTVTFFVVMPYALLDTNHFLDGIGFPATTLQGIGPSGR